MNLTKRISRGLLFLILGLVSSLNAADTAAISKLLDKYESRGLPKFRAPELYKEISERLENHNGTTAILAGRYLKYQELIEAQRRSQKLPWFVGFIPAANTGFEPRFRNESGFAGMWPLPYLMGKKYGLLQTALYDERHDAQKATAASCKYLSDLQNIYQDWLKSVTAYSVGPARFNQVIHATKTLDFDSIYKELEPEERIPIIQFLATTVAISEWLEAENPVASNTSVALTQVQGIEQPIPFSLFDTKFNIGIAQMREYNPGLRTDLIPYMGTPFTFYLPIAAAERYNTARDSISVWLNGAPEMELTYDTLTQVFDGDTVVVVEPKQGAEVPDLIEPRDEKVWVYYKIKRGDALYTITDVFDCTVPEIRRWNNLNSKMFLIAGKRLKFYVPASKKKYYQKIDAMSLAQKRQRAKTDD